MRMVSVSSPSGAPGHLLCGLQQGFGSGQSRSLLARQLRDEAGRACRRGLSLACWSRLPALNGATRTLTSSYLYYHDVFEQDPDAAGPWTGAAVAAMEIGVETVT
jgi:hypothetical protein